MSAIDLLCPQCGLCCNGVLFGDVELQRDDKPGRLVDLGVALSAKGSKRVFSQPCSKYDGKLCTIYGDRPRRCHTFVCNQLRLVESGQLPVNAAVRNIRVAKRCVDDVVQLVRALGGTDEALALNQRCAAIMAAPINLAADEASVALRSELMLAVAKLMGLLERDFLVLRL